MIKMELFEIADGKQLQKVPRKWFHLVKVQEFEILNNSSGAFIEKAEERGKR